MFWYIQVLVSKMVRMLRLVMLFSEYFFVVEYGKL